LRQSYWEIRSLGVDLVAAANDTPETNKRLRERYDLPFSILSDEGAEVAKAYRAYHVNEPRGRDIALVSLFLIDRAENGGTILWEYVGPSSRYRLAPSRIMEELQSALGRTRKVVGVVVPSQWQVERAIAAYQDPPLGIYRTVLTYRDYTRELVMQAHAEVHRLTEAGWTLTAVSPEFEGNLVIGQRYVFVRNDPAASRPADG
jgi:hypothetical protein